MGYTRVRTRTIEPRWCWWTFRRRFGPPDILLLAVLSAALWPADVRAVKINNLGMPAPIVNGSTPAIILDCDYKYDLNEKKGLVLKWYYNDDQSPVYQWIPPSAPEASGPLAERLDLNHKITEDPYTMHRALRILWPTVELAGNYKCQVSSFHGEDEENQNLVIYVPASKVEINYTKPTERSVNVTCLAENMYPEPDVSLLLYRNGAREPEKLSDTKLHIFTERDEVVDDGDDDGGYDAILYAILEDHRLSQETTFECVFSIPQAHYKISDQITYYPGLSETTTPPSSTHVFLTDLISTESSLIDLQSIGAGSQVIARPFALYGLITTACLTVSRFLARLS